MLATYAHMGIFVPVSFGGQLLPCDGVNVPGAHLGRAHPEAQFFSATVAFSISVRCDDLTVTVLRPAGPFALAQTSSTILSKKPKCKTSKTVKLNFVCWRAQGCERLRKIDATFCGALTGAALASALTSKPPLKSLVLSVCPQVRPDKHYSVLPLHLYAASDA